MRYLTLSEVLELYNGLMAQSGGLMGIQDLGALESALAQPRATYGGEELHLTIAEKAAALGFSIIANHPFLDGNKRIGHAAMETFLVLNGYEIKASVDEQEDIIQQVASGRMGRREFSEWLRCHVVARSVS